MSQNSDSQTSGQYEPHDIYKTIGLILRYGVVISSVIIIFGFLLVAFNAHNLSQNLQLFPKTFAQLWQELIVLNPQSVVTAGLFLLIGVPVIRVAVSIIAFLVERDWKFVVITLFVLLILLWSLFTGGKQVTYHHLYQPQFTYSDMLLLFILAIVAGILGSLVGLGGGVLIVPILTLMFNFPMYYAIGASIISVIATSSGAASAYVKEHLTNIRVGMFLEVATTIGAISGAFLAAKLAQNMLSIIFGIILLVSSIPLLVKIGEELPENVTNDKLATFLKLNGSYPDRKLKRTVSYQVARTPAGLCMMYIAGIISGLLGIGSGTFKVLALDVAMRLPMKVSTTTSNFMIGVTAAASAGIYFARGDILPLVAAPIALGTLIGSIFGSRILHRLSNKFLRVLFIIVLIIAAIEMISHGI